MLRSHPLLLAHQAPILRRGISLKGAIMALDTQQAIITYDAPKKDLYEVGEMPPLGHVPKQMYAWAIRRDRHGEPMQSFQQEVVDTWQIDSHEVLVLVMAAGVNYNGVWAGLGQPISPFDGHKQPYHIAGSDAAGIVWAVGDKVTRWKVGDEVVIHCNQDDGDDEECNGGDPMFSPTQRIWGYETPDGSFAQFTRVQARQLLQKPQHLSWEEASCYTLTLATNATLITSPLLSSQTTYRADRDFTALGGVGRTPLVVVTSVNPDAPRSFRELRGFLCLNADP